MSREAIFRSTAYWLQRAYHREREAWAITYHERFGQVGRVVVTPDMLEVA